MNVASGDGKVLHPMESLRSAEQVWDIEENTLASLTPA